MVVSIDAGGAALDFVLGTATDEVVGSSRDLDTGDGRTRSALLDIATSGVVFGPIRCQPAKATINVKPATATQIKGCIAQADLDGLRLTRLPQDS